MGSFVVSSVLGVIGLRCLVGLAGITYWQMQSKRFFAAYTAACDHHDFAACERFSKAATLILHRGDGLRNILLFGEWRVALAYRDYLRSR